MAVSSQPDVIWFDKALWVYPSTLRQLKARSCFLAHYSTDDVMIDRLQNSLHRAVLSRYDLYFTTNRFNVMELKQRYGALTVRAAQGYDPALHIPVGQGALSRSASYADNGTVVFIGHWEPATEQMILSLSSAGVPVSLWGQNWHKAHDPYLRRTRALPQERYLSVLGGAAIGLCFLSKINRNESTGRSFEITAVAVPLLTERTAEHQYCYRDDVEAALFGDREELVSQATRLLGNPTHRADIAAAGHRRCRALGLSLPEHMAREWRTLDRLRDGGPSYHPSDDAPFWPGFRLGHAFIPGQNDT